MGRFVDDFPSCKWTASEIGFKNHHANPENDELSTLRSGCTVYTYLSKHKKSFVVGQNPVLLVNIKIAAKQVFIPQKGISIGVDP